MAAVVGHCWSPFIRFKGGKGVATGAGAALALFPDGVGDVPVLAAIVWATRYVSLGSLTAALLAAAVGDCRCLRQGGSTGPSPSPLPPSPSIIVFATRATSTGCATGTERRIGRVDSGLTFARAHRDLHSRREIAVATSRPTGPFRRGSNARGASQKLMRLVTSRQ